MLAVMDKEAGQLMQGSILPQSQGATTAKLSDIGITKMQSSRWQSLPVQVPDMLIKYRGFTMAQHGGKRKGAGRRRGSANIRSREAVAKAEELGILPLDVMLEAMRTAYEAGGAVAAFTYAKDAAPYLHAKLSATELNAQVSTEPKTLAEFYGGLSDEANKATATLTKTRRLELGITEAEWMHSGGGSTLDHRT